MHTIKPSELIELGKIISTIRAIEPDTSVKDAYWKLQRLFELLDLAGLKGTIGEITNSAAALRNELDQIESIDYAISMELAIHFESFAEQVQNELERECRKSRIFVPTIDAGELEKLIDPDKFISEFKLGVLGWIPRVAKEDLQDAARCLAYDMYTGAASLMLRATEACLGKFYRLYCQEEPFDKDYHIKKKKGKKEKKDCKETGEVDPASEPKKRSQLIPKSYMWSDMLSRLQGKSLNQIDPDLYVELEILVKYFRNPIQHAARRYIDYREVADLWKNCKSAVNQMFTRIDCEGILLKVCMPWPCDLDTLFAIYLINKYAGLIGDWNFVDNAKDQRHQGSYVVNCARGQFDRSQLKEPKSASWMLIKHFCLPEGGDFQKLLNHVNAAVVHKSNHKGNPPKGLWAYVDWYMKNKVRAASSQETIEKLLLDKLLPLVELYIGDQNPADQATLRDFIHKLDLPQQD